MTSLWPSTRYGISRSEGVEAGFQLAPVEHADVAAGDCIRFQPFRFSEFPYLDRELPPLRLSLAAKLQPPVLSTSPSVS